MASALPHDPHVAVPIAAYQSQRPHTMPIWRSIRDASLAATKPLGQKYHSLEAKTVTR